MDHNSVLLGGTTSQNIALLTQAAQIRGAIALLQTQHQSIMSSFGSPFDHQNQVPCPRLQNTSTEPMASGAIYSPAHTLLPPMRSHDLLPAPVQGQPYIQLGDSLLSAQQRFHVQYGGPLQHRQILSDPIHADYSGNITQNYPLAATHHGAPRHPALLHQLPASRPSPADAPQPRGASILKPRPAARQNDAGDGAAAA
eukprot:CAMPEP_0172153148 /NCGR_PEP_ID=MMETSP1050-20130122/1262_1 /TAXON_ID=233186 /ORGANISM="Cryptomonas curvata, Strain CCAP979/52" /LENGTH=197 /DNA_ID=CAMNT_0012821609 /DNA_START=95 /DNA_END=684 /DNA_ORIENTATION=+